MAETLINFRSYLNVVDNKKYQHQLTRNTSFLTLALIIQKILSLIYFTYLARSIGTANIGAYSFALTFVGVFGIFIDFGLGPVLTREISKYPEKAQKYFSSILTTKVFLSVFALTSLFIIFHFLLGIRPLPVSTRYMVYAAAFIIIFDSFTFTFYSLFRAWQQIYVEALGVVLYQFLIVTLGIYFIFSNKPAIYFIGAVLAGSIFHFVYSLCLLIIKGKIVVQFDFDWRVVKKLFLISLPFALAAIFYRLNGSIDQTMLEFMAGERYVGWYATAYKLSFALTVLPGAFATSFFPIMSACYLKNLKDLARVFEKAVLYLIVISVPITIGIIVLGKDIVISLYKKSFSASGDALYIFGIGIIFVFLNYPVGNLLNACNRQFRNTVHMGIALLCNVVLNILLIPRSDRFGTYIGASIAALVSNAVLVGLGLSVVGKIIHYNKKFLMQRSFRILAAGCIMGGILWLLKPYVPVIVAFLISPLIYCCGLLLTRAMSSKEIYGLYLSFRKRTV